MNATLRRLLDEAMEAPEADRAIIAAALLNSLDPPCETVSPEAWEAEIRRRVEDLESGRVRAIPWPEAEAMILGTRADESRDT